MLQLSDYRSPFAGQLARRVRLGEQGYGGEKCEESIERSEIEDRISRQLEHPESQYPLVHPNHRKKARGLNIIQATLPYYVVYYLPYHRHHACYRI